MQCSFQVKMSSQENLVQEDVIQTTNTDNKEPSDEVKDVEAKLSSDNQSKENDETTGSLSSKATIETSTNGAIKSTGAIVELTNGISSTNYPVETNIIMKSDATDFIEIKKDTSLESEGAVKCVSSFRLEFNDVAGVCTISPSKAWIHNFHKLKLVDIEKGEVLRSYYSEAPFGFVNGLNENIVFLSFHYEIDRLSINDDDTNTLVTLLNYSSGIEQSDPCRLNAFSVSKSGDFLVCITRKAGCLCFAKEISYIERFDSRANFKHRSKIQNKGKNIIGEAYDVLENNNGDICIAGEKFCDRGEFWVVVLDSKFQFRFSYDRNTSTQIHVPSSIATDRRNNILIVNKFRDRIKRKKSSLINKKKKELTYVAIIDEDGIFRDHLPTEGFNIDGTVINITTDNDGKVWIILDSGQVIVATFDYLSKDAKQADST